VWRLRSLKNMYEEVPGPESFRHNPNHTQSQADGVLSVLLRDCQLQAHLRTQLLF
jgi:hypothetical protein